MPEVVFVHGFGGSKWEYQPLVRALTEKGIKEIHQFTYRERLGTLPLNKLAEKLGGFIRAKVRGNKFSIIGLSQGGIIAAWWLEFLGGKSICQRCVTVCSPFYGSLLSYFLPLPGLRDLQPTSRFLSLLRQAIASSQVDYLSIWNPFDLFVFPGLSGKCPGKQKSLCVLAPAHLFTFWMPQTVNWVCQAVVKA
ncbi:MAG: hypothetical protein NC911_00725 [Candidatus Omnitrophica bacterium]|nr:hypothetical protein [Candidatus Omnitrophota bacterium]